MWGSTSGHRSGAPLVLGGGFQQRHMALSTAPSARMADTTPELVSFGPPILCAPSTHWPLPHPGGGKRLDVFVVPSLVWDVFTPMSYYIQQYPSARDHAGVIMHANVALPMAGAPSQATPNILNWVRRDMQKFRAHFTR